MSEAEDRLLVRLRQEVEAALGPHITVSEVRRAVQPSGVGLIVDCQTPLGPWRIDAVGSSIVEAASRLIRQAAEDRLAIAFREVTTPR